MYLYPKASYEKEPFPHAVIVGGWPETIIDVCKAETKNFSAWDGLRDSGNTGKKRYCSTWDKFPPIIKQVIRECYDPPFLRYLRELTGEKGLLPDPYLHGGGMHRVESGGWLKIHADFNYHEELRLYRRLNLLLYLNRNWQDEWGGHLELCGEMGRKLVRPEANVMVVFTTDDASFHGHPTPMACPDTVTRDSIALYYYSAIRPTRNFAGERLNTDYRG